MHLSIKSYSNQDDNSLKSNTKSKVKATPLIILHGLFGEGANWKTIAKNLSSDCNIVTMDLRNHGHSDHDLEHNYKVMADDVIETIHTAVELQEITHFNLLGHSMGGKVAMEIASVLQEKELKGETKKKLNKLIVLDIAPKKYKRHHDDILEGLNKIDIDTLSSRAQAEEILLAYIKDQSLVGFLLKSLKPVDGKYKWQINIPVLTKEYENILEPPSIVNKIKTPTLFMRGANSEYILIEDAAIINEYFVDVKMVDIKNAGHWLHAEQPEQVMAEIKSFLNQS